MNKTERNNSCIKERIVLSINAFKVKFGYWCVEIDAYAEALAPLAIGHLTRLHLLWEKLVNIRQDLVALQGAGYGR
jgi:hypothetical protein